MKRILSVACLLILLSPCLARAADPQRWEYATLVFSAFTNAISKGEADSFTTPAKSFDAKSVAELCAALGKPDGKTRTDVFNAIGAQGWELVVWNVDNGSSATTALRTDVYIFKRPAK
jgi:hypothetical protein